MPPSRYPSRVGHVKPGLNRRGPSPKAKHSMTTDSEPRRATERGGKTPHGGKNPDQGRTLNLKPRAYERWEGIDLRVSLTACLLHNDPASYCARPQVNPFRGGA